MILARAPHPPPNSPCAHTHCTQYMYTASVIMARAADPAPSNRPRAHTLHTRCMPLGMEGLQRFPRVGHRCLLACSSHMLRLFIVVPQYMVCGSRERPPTSSRRLHPSRTADRDATAQLARYQGEALLRYLFSQHACLSRMGRSLDSRSPSRRESPTTLSGSQAHSSSSPSQAESTIPTSTRLGCRAPASRETCRWRCLRGDTSKRRGAGGTRSWASARSGRTRD